MTKHLSPELAGILSSAREPLGSQISGLEAALLGIGHAIMNEDDRVGRGKPATGLRPLRLSRFVCLAAARRSVILLRDNEPAILAFIAQQRASA